MRATTHPTRRTTTIKTILWGLAISIALCVPTSVPARCSLERASVGDVESMLQSGDYAEFKARYSGLDCLVAFYDSLAVLSPLLGWEPVQPWSSAFTFWPIDTYLALDPQPSTQYCSLWMRGLFWIYLSAHNKRIHGQEEGRLCCIPQLGELRPARPVYDLERWMSVRFHIGGISRQSPEWTADEGLMRTLDQLYCDAILDSEHLTSLAHQLDAGLAANDLAWRIEQATVYNSVMPASAVLERRYDIRQ